MAQAESLMSPPLRGRMRDGAVPQSKPAIPRDSLMDKGRQTLFRRNFLSRISDVGLGIAERLLGITSSLLCCSSSLAGQTVMQQQTVLGSGLCASGYDSQRRWASPELGKWFQPR